MPVPYISYRPISLYLVSSLCFYVHLDIPMIFCTEILLFKGNWEGSPLSESLMSISPHFHWSHTWTLECPDKSCSSSFTYMYMSVYWGTIHKKSPQLHGSHLWTVSFPTQNSYILLCIHHIHSLSLAQLCTVFERPIRLNSRRWIIIMMLVICNNSNSFIYLLIYLLANYGFKYTTTNQGKSKARAKNSIVINLVKSQS